MMSGTGSGKDSPIQYRPGGSFDHLLTDLAQLWGVSPNEVAKRLAMLAAYELDGRLYEAVVTMADVMGGIHSFEQTCQHISAALESANRTRTATKQQALDENERIKFILET